MVCCALIAIILTGLFWPIRIILKRFRPTKAAPLMWQLSAGESSDMNAPRFSLTERIKSFGYALSGLHFVIRNEHNARLHVIAAIAVIAIGVFYQISQADWLILILSIVGVWFAETINTAFEYLCDVVSPQKNEAVRHAKDIAAGAVLITAIGAALIGIIVIYPYVAGSLNPNEGHIDFLKIAANNLCSVK